MNYKTTYKGKRVHKGDFLFSGAIWCFWVVLALAFGLAMGVVSADNSLYPFTARENISVWPFVVVVLLIPATVMYSIKECKKKIKKFSKITDEMFLQQVESVKNRALYTGSFAAMVGVLLSGEISRQYPEAVPIVFFIFTLGFVLLFLPMACAKFYKVHLIKKYCPYLETPEGSRYNKDIEIDK